MADVKRIIEVLIKARSDLIGLSKAKAELRDFGADATKAGAGMVAAGSAIIGALSGITLAAAKSSAQIYDLSQRTGASAESLSTLRSVAEQNGTSIESLGMAMKFLAKNAVDAKDGNKDLAASFQKIGVNVVDSNGKLKSSEKLLYEVSDGMKLLSTDSERTNLMLTLMGRNAFELAEFMKLGSAGIRQGQDSARAFGQEISGTAAKAADDFDDSLTNLKRTIGGLSQTISGQLIPAIQPMVEQAAKAIAKFREWSNEHPELAAKSMQLATTLVGAGGIMMALGLISTTLSKGVAAATAFWGALTSPAGIAAALLVAVATAADLAKNKIREAREEAQKEVGAKPLHGTTAPPGTYGIGAPGSSAVGMEATPESTWMHQQGKPKPKVVPIDDQIKAVEEKIKAEQEPDKLEALNMELWKLQKHKAFPKAVPESAATEATWNGDEIIPQETPPAWSMSFGAKAAWGLPGPRGSKSTKGEDQATKKVEELGAVAQESVAAISAIPSAIGDFGKALVMGGNAVDVFGKSMLNVAANLVGNLLQRGATTLLGGFLHLIGLSTGGVIVGGGVQRFAHGGIAGRDSILGLLTPGEIVLPPRLSQLLMKGGSSFGAPVNVTINAQAFAGDRAQAMAFADMIAKATTERTTGWRQ